jgi:TRAP-type mannitol/chloroaromatic compound transport system permease small subunit
VPIYQFKTVIVAAGLLLFVQGMAQVCRCILAMRTNEWLAADEDVFETEDLLMQQAAEAEKDAHP